MKEDVELFNIVAQEFLTEEAKNPVSEFIEIKE